MAQGRHKSNFLHGGGIVQTDSAEWVVIKDTHPAIISADTFEAVKKIRKTRKQNYKTDENQIRSDNIFKGLIVCGDCKAHMQRKKVRRNNGRVECHFLCNIYEQVDKNACTKKKVMEADIQTALYSCVSREIDLAVDMCRIIMDIQKSSQYQCRRSSLDEQIKVLQMKLEKNRRFRGSLREDYIDGILSENDYATMMADYDEEKGGLQKELDILIADKKHQDNTLSIENKWIAEFRRFEKEQSLSAQMVSSLVERIEVYDSMRIDVTLRYRDEYKFLQDHIKSPGQEERAANG